MNLKRGISAIPVIILILVIALAGVAYVYFNKSDSADIAGLTPNEILQSAQVNAIESGSYSMNATLDLDMSISDQGVAYGIMTSGNVSGYVNATDVANPAVDLKIRIEEISLDSEGPYDLKFGPIDFDLKNIDQVGYLRVNEANLGFFDFTDFEGIWLEIDPTALATAGGVSSAEIEEAMAQQRAMSRAVSEALIEKISTTNIYNFVEELDSEIIDGVETLHYRVEIGEEGVVVLIDEVLAVYEEAGLFDELSQSEREDIEEILPELKDAIRMFPWEDLDIEVWIGKEDLLSRRSMVTMDLSSIGRLLKSLDDTAPDMSGSLVITTEAGDFGSNRSVDVPSGARPFLEVMEEVFGTSGLL